MKPWLLRVLAESDEVLEIAIYDIIGRDFWGEGVSAGQVLAQVRSRPNAKTIRLRVNSLGGLVDDAKAMVNVLGERAAASVAVEGYVDGLAASAAAFLLTVCTKVVMPDNAFIMIHKARAGMSGTDADMTRAAQVLSAVDDQIAEAYAAASKRRGKGKTKADFLAAMASGDRYFQADEAIAWGLADEKVAGLKVAACSVDIEGLENIPEAVTAILPTPPAPGSKPAQTTPPSGGPAPGATGHREQDHMDLKILAKLLGLSENATAEEVTAAINKLTSAPAATPSVNVSGVTLLGVANEAEATAKIKDFQSSILQLLGATGKASVAEAMGVLLEWKTKAEQTDGLTKQVAQLTESARVAKRDAAIEKLSREGSLPPARHEWARAQFATAEAVETFCAGMPKGFFGSAITEQTTPEASLALTAEEKNICKVLGMSEDQYLEEKKTLLRKAG